MKTALITGITGQDGSYLAELLLERGYEVYGLMRRNANQIYPNIERIQDRIHFVEGDLLEESRINKIIREHTFDEIYNLAAQSFVPYSWTNPLYTVNVNALGVLRMLEAIRIYSLETKFYQASSSEMFGKIQEMPQNEMTYHYPRSPYGCSKSFGFNITRNYRESYGLFACNGILFNHEGERRGLQFVTRKITNSVAKIHLGLQDKLVLGNLNAKRDWGYAPDYVRAMWMMLQHKKPDDYVIATGETHTVREFCDIAFGHIGIELEWNGKGIGEKGIDRSTGKVLVESSPEYWRPAEVDVLLGNPAKAKRVLGWMPNVSFKEMIERMVENDLKLLEVYEVGA